MPQHTCSHGHYYGRRRLGFAAHDSGLFLRASWSALVLGLGLAMGKVLGVGLRLVLGVRLSEGFLFFREDGLA